MAFDGHANLAVSLVATAPSPATSGTSLVVTAGQGTRFPTPPFQASIWPAGQNPDPSNAEIVRVTAVSTDTLTITRAQESTSARTVVVGDYIAATITKKTITDIEARITAGYTLLDEQTVTGSVVGQIDIVQISTAYKSLMLEVMVRGDLAASFSDLLHLRLSTNTTSTPTPDTGSNYYWQTGGFNAAVTSGIAESGGTTTAIRVGLMPAASSPANAFDTVRVWFPDYLGAQFKVVEAHCVHRGTTGAGSMVIQHAGGTWSNTGNIRQIRLIPVSGALQIGTVSRLYGLPV